MTTTTDPQTDSFHLSQLLYDSRYRSMTIQVVALIGFVSLVAWLVSNTIVNLEALGKNFSFGFLGQRSGYDINQRLISYSSDSNHFTAAAVGLLNTLLVAFLGCILATVIGVTAGVLRLSRNWITAKIMTVYIESFRNIPVLLWILAFNAVMTEGFPSPRDFKGDNATASMLFNDSVAVTNRGIFAPLPIWENGYQIVVIVFLLSIAAIWAFGRYAKKRQELTGDILPVFWIKLAILVLPVLIAYFVLGRPIGLEYPELKGFGFKGGLNIRRSLIVLWLALSFYTGAFIAENVRAGILAISKGQSEAAHALGINPKNTMSLVVLPQALRVIIPPLISQYLNLTKNSSLAIAVGYMDVRSTLGGITLNQTGRELECMLLLMGIYLLISLAISGAMNVYNKSTQLAER
ncbi:MAG: ABC transporter permease subunit [Marinosulfonomonas sp.]|nr:ABC transporter permease subunit [Marinosulfonomonas sp.]